jgi:hypothetical protein
VFHQLQTATVRQDDARRSVPLCMNAITPRSLSSVENHGVQRRLSFFERDIRDCSQLPWNVLGMVGNQVLEWVELVTE